MFQRKIESGTIEPIGNLIEDFSEEEEVSEEMPIEIAPSIQEHGHETFMKIDDLGNPEEFPESGSHENLSLEQRLFARAAEKERKLTKGKSETPRQRRPERRLEQNRASTPIVTKPIERNEIASSEPKRKQNF